MVDVVDVVVDVVDIVDVYVVEDEKILFLDVEIWIFVFFANSFFCKGQNGIQVVASASASQVLD